MLEMKANLFKNVRSFISEETKENLAPLKEVIKNSIDNPPTPEQIQTVKDNFQGIIADGKITPAEKEQVKTGLKDTFDALGITPDELKEIKSTAKEVFGDAPLFEQLADKKANLAPLKEVIKNSIDNPPTPEQIETVKNNFQDIIADGKITPGEKEQIKTGLKDTFDALGITPDELKEIKSTAKEVFGDSSLFGISETLVGMDGTDPLLSIDTKDLPLMPPSDLKYDLGSLGSELDALFNNFGPTNPALVADMMSQVPANNFEAGFEFI